MLSDTILNALNDQIGRERFAAITYCQMSCWASNNQLHGFHEYFEEQAKEEGCHAHKFINYILHQQGQVILKSIPEPTHNWANALAVFEDVIALEQQVTALINNLMKLSIVEGDFATQSILQWFIDEQVKGEFEVNTILEKLRMIGDDKSALLALDSELEPAPNTQDFWNIKSDENV